MAATAGVETTLDAMVAKLQAGMPSKLAAITAEHADGIVLDDPHEVVLSVTDSPSGWPCVMVLPADSPTTVDTGGLVLTNHTVEVWAWIIDPDPQVLARKCLRYTRAIKETLLANRRPGSAGAPAGYGLQHVRDRYSGVFRPPAEDGGSGAYVEQLCSCVFTVQQQQYL